MRTTSRIIFVIIIASICITGGIIIDRYIPRKQQQRGYTLLDETGRYQLTAATVTIGCDPPPDGPGTTEERNLFKIDTITGRVWKYTAIRSKNFDENKQCQITADGWIAIPEGELEGPPILYMLLQP